MNFRKVQAASKKLTDPKPDRVVLSLLSVGPCNIALKLLKGSDRLRLSCISVDPSFVCNWLVIDCCCLVRSDKFLCSIWADWIESGSCKHKLKPNMWYITFPTILWTKRSESNCRGYFGRKSSALDLIVFIRCKTEIGRFEQLQQRIGTFCSSRRLPI